MEGENGVNRSIIDEFNSSEIEGDEMEGESGVTWSIIDELHSSNMVKWKERVVLLNVSLKNFIIGISKELDWNVKVVLFEVSLINFILRIFK